MANDYSELVEYLDKKFVGVDRRFDAAEKQVGQHFEAVEGRLTTLESKFDALLSSVDAYMKLGETYYQEMLALGSKVDRLERWLHQVADKVGIKLEY